MTVDTTDTRNVIIIGSGPAGYTAAVYAARAELRPLVLEGAQLGGALMTTTEVENFPGFATGILGPELMDSMRRQAERFGAELVTTDVTAVDLTGPVKIVRTSEEEFRARSVILATGSAWRRLGVPGEDELLGHGVSSCATCDGFFFRGQDIAVVGGGDSAMEEALFLTRFADSVTVIHRRDGLRASRIMAARALSHPKISFAWNSVVEEVLGSGSVSGVRIRDVTSGATSELAVRGVFVAIGHDPRSELFLDQVATDDEGYIRVESPGTATSQAGVFAAGDVVDHTYRQAVTAAGTGCAAALDAERWLASISHDSSLVVTG